MSTSLALPGFAPSLPVPFAGGAVLCAFAGTADLSPLVQRCSSRFVGCYSS